MKCVFQASTSIEAYMIKGLLESSNIPAEVFGEHLQSGIGEIQAIGVVRVMVAEELANEATSIIQEWESKEPEHDPDYKPNQEIRSQGFSFWSFGAGFVLACVICVFILT